MPLICISELSLFFIFVLNLNYFLKCKGVHNPSLLGAAPAGGLECCPVIIDSNKVRVYPSSLYSPHPPLISPISPPLLPSSFSKRSGAVHLRPFVQRNQRLRHPPSHDGRPASTATSSGFDYLHSYLQCISTEYPKYLFKP